MFLDVSYAQGAAEGAGLGNAFLSHIRAVDAIFMMLRAFEDADITHVEGDVNPVRDIEIINEELLLKVFRVSSPCCCVAAATGFGV